MLSREGARGGPGLFLLACLKADAFFRFVWVVEGWHKGGVLPVGYAQFLRGGGGRSTLPALELTSRCFACRDIQRVFLDLLQSRGFTPGTTRGIPLRERSRL